MTLAIHRRIGAAIIVAAFNLLAIVVPLFEWASRGAAGGPGFCSASSYLSFPRGAAGGPGLFEWASRGAAGGPGFRASSSRFIGFEGEATLAAALSIGGPLSRARLAAALRDWERCKEGGETARRRRRRRRRSEGGTSRGWLAFSPASPWSLAAACSPR